MGFFDRNRVEMERRGINPSRLPPGQYMTDRFPVLHAGEVPHYQDLDAWDLAISGEVEAPARLGFRELRGLGVEERTTDIHCVTKWSKFDTSWSGVPMARIFELVKPLPSATHLIVWAEYGFSTNVPLAEVVSDPLAMLALEYGGEPLEPDHGYPVRFLMPSLYFWKSAKWVRGLEFSRTDSPGFWERNGYHNHGDPWSEERFS